MSLAGGSDARLSTAVGVESVACRTLGVGGEPNKSVAKDPLGWPEVDSSVS